jgi:hypothetical protein
MNAPQHLLLLIATLEMFAVGVLRSDDIRDHPGIPFGFPPERAFSFAGIPACPGSPAKGQDQGPTWSR